MSASLRWRFILGFSLVFIAGIALGGFIGVMRSRHDGLNGPHNQLLAERLRNRMQMRLDLTPEQLAKTAPVFDKAARELEQIRTDTARRVHEVMAEADHDLTPALTAEQRAKLKALEAFRLGKAIPGGAHLP